MKGESVIIINPRAGFKIDYIMPCKSIKGKKMANARIFVNQSPGDILSLLGKNFPGAKKYPNVHAAQIEWEGKRILVSVPGTKYINVKITKAQNKDDIIKTVNHLCEALKGNYE